MIHTTAITVAISTRERPKALANCLDALLAGQALPGEIVVVDQSLDPKTRQVVEQRQSTRMPIIYLHHAGRGLGVSQNIAIQHAHYPVVAVTDDDCIPTAEWLATIERAFAAPDKLDAMTGRVLALGPDLPGTFPVSLRTSSLPVEFDRSALPWEIGSGNNFAVRREWLLRIGGNDERLGPGAPGQGGVDMDLFYRLLRAGARIRYEPDALVYHERTDSAGRMSRRGPYGHGMGAACVLWMRQGDWNALRVLAHWFHMRVWRMLGAVRRRDAGTGEEVLVVGGTVRGMLYGLRARSRSTSLSRAKR